MDAHVSAMNGEVGEEELEYDVLTKGECMWLDASFDQAVDRGARDYLTKDEFVHAVIALAEEPPSSQVRNQTACVTRLSSFVMEGNSLL